MDILCLIVRPNYISYGFLALEVRRSEKILDKSGYYKGGYLEPVLPDDPSPQAQDIYSHSHSIGKNLVLLNLSDPPDFLYSLLKAAALFFPMKRSRYCAVTSIERCHTLPDSDGKAMNISGLSYSVKMNRLFFQFNHSAQILTNPSVKLFVSASQPTCAECWFEYGPTELPADDKRTSIYTENFLIVRNRTEEQRLVHLLLKNGLHKIDAKHYSCTNTGFTSLLCSHLETLGVHVLFEKNTDNHSSAQAVSLQLTPYGKDWLELSLFCKESQKVVDLSKQIDLRSSHVRTSGGYLSLPQELVDNSGLIEYRGRRLLLSRKNLWFILQLQKYTSNSSVFTPLSQVNFASSLAPGIQLRPYQLEGSVWIKWLWTNQLGGCLADDMGLGKTLQTIAVFTDPDIQQLCRRVLIIVPKTLISNWKSEFRRFAPALNIYLYHGSGRVLPSENWHGVLLTTYTTAGNAVDALNQIGLDAIVFDEIHTLKNHKTKTSSQLKKLKARFHLGLSGTPMENNISELWNVLDLLNPGLIGKRTDFCRRYSDGQNNDELRTILSFLLLRRTKKQVLSELPEKEEHLIYCDFSDEEANLYHAIRLAVISRIRKTGYVSSVILTGILRLRQCCCHPSILDKNSNPSGLSSSAKFNVCTDLISNLVFSGQKVLVFSQFAQMLKLLYSWAQKNHISSFYLDGNTTNRQVEVDRFEHSDAGVFFISLKAGSLGLNLTSAHEVILYEPWWNPFPEKQASDRVYRIGQTHKVNVYKLIVANSIEEKILQLQTEKSELFHHTVDNLPTASPKLSLDDILSLLDL